MIEVIAWAPDMATMSKAANATGFVDKVVDPVTKAVIKESIKTHGSWQGSKGGWALAIVPQFMQPTGKMIEGPLGEIPEMAPVPGVFARLRWNDMALLERFEQFIAAVKVQGVTVYSRENIGTAEKPHWVWTDGGLDPAPDYLDSVGVML